MAEDKELEDRVEGEKTLSNNAVIINKKSNPLMYGLGQLLSIPAKILLFDTKVGAHPKKETIDTIVQNVEGNDKLSNLTVRVGHTAPLKDTYRLLTDKKIKEEVPLYLRILGIPTTLLGGTLAHLFRMDHYNPFTHTASIYSDIPAVGMHEVGHANFYAKKRGGRLPRLLLQLSGIGTLYHEYRASKYANASLEPHLKYQTGRYLFPAFGTYLGYVAGVGPLVGAIGGLIAGGLYSMIQRNYLKAKSVQKTPASSPTS